MAKYGGSSVGFVLVGGYSLMGLTKEIPQGGDVESLFEETHALGDSWVEQTPTGLKKGTFSQTAWYDDDTLQTNEAFVGNTSSSRVICVGHEGNTIGKRFIGLAGAFANKFSRLLSRGALHYCNVGYTVSGQVEQGIILQELEQKTTTDWNTDSESVDNAASSANGGAGYLQVTEQAAGVTGFIGKIRHSPDDAVYADLITFSNVTTEPAAERVTVSGTVDRHLLFAGDITGTGTITVMAGFVRNP